MSESPPFRAMSCLLKNILHSIQVPIKKWPWIAYEVKTDGVYPKGGIEISGLHYIIR